MNHTYIVFDVETPNSYNNRMSAIGISVIENGQITEEYFSLVNPEQPFDAFNIDLTGISPDMVADKPTFGELWQDLESVFRRGTLVAHNARFDMGVLAKCLRDYDIVWETKVPYLCTVTMGRVCYPYLPNHRLNTLSNHCGIMLDHHQADSDSHACGSLLINYMNKGLCPMDHVRYFDMVGMRTLRK